MKYTCKCGQPVEFPPEMIGTEHVCPSCRRVNILDDRHSATAKPPVEPQPKPKAANPANPKKEFLKQVRAQSCYGTLRQVIDLCIGLPLVILGGMAVMGVVQLFSESPIGPEPSTTIYAIVTLAVSIVLLLAARQAAMVVIDIADLQIHQQAGKSYSV